MAEAECAASPDLAITGKERRERDVTVLGYAYIHTPVNYSTKCSLRMPDACAVQVAVREVYLITHLPFVCS